MTLVATLVATPVATPVATLEERVNLLEKEVARLTLFYSLYRLRAANEANKMTSKFDLKMLPINATPKPLP